ncbi:hypothetical protein, partial [Paenibacillus sepulcri]|uniref:hypothetical protein n=1 Tax=Paenibacillus sepulcri TaxID=359917 RepID=UPI0035F09B35
VDRFEVEASQDVQLTNTNRSRAYPTPEQEQSCSTRQPKGWREIDPLNVSQTFVSSFQGVTTRSITVP